jgi:hypothetical protein
MLKRQSSLPQLEKQLPDCKKKQLGDWRYVAKPQLLNHNVTKTEVPSR